MGNAENNRTTTSCRNDLSGFLRRNHSDAEGSFDLMKRVTNRLKKIAAVAIANQVSEHFGIRFRNKLAAFCF